MNTFRTFLLIGLGLVGGPAAAADVVMPIEVMGTPSAQKSAPLTLSTAQVTSAKRLFLSLHGLTFEKQASVQVNDGAWLPLNNQTVQIENSAKRYGGIGGPIATFQLSVPVTGLRTGANTLSFRFNGTDGISSGFRVLKIDLLDASNQFVLKGAGFTEEDPNQWTAPRPGATDVATGKQLWQTAVLRKNPLGSTTMQARCTDCHAQDGRDLKYFNYSNFAIIERSKFHGLSQVQGEQIASYIRSLNAPNPGRPWNPPYQPGPGMDTKPVSEWSAGAGLDAVLERDADMLPHLFPQGITQEAVSRKGRINLRELPISLPLPDWNRWLPKIHPKDAFGAAFENNGASTLYPTVRRAALTPAQFPAAETNWANYIRGLLLNYRPSNVWDPKLWPLDLAEKFHSTRLWQLVKLWEIHQEFGLESRAPSVFGGPYAEGREWLTRQVWMVSPHELWIAPQAVVGLSPLGTPANSNWAPSWLYFTNSWFYLQLLLNSGDNSTSFTAPELEYLDGHAFALNGLGDPQPLRNVAAYVRWLQVHPSTDSRFTYWAKGWDPFLIQPTVFGVEKAGLPVDQRNAVLGVLLREWVDTNREMPSPFSLRFFDPTYKAPTNLSNSLGWRTYNNIRVLQGLGVETGYAVDWAKTLWTQAPGEWEKLRR